MTYCPDLFIWVYNNLYLLNIIIELNSYSHFFSIPGHGVWLNLFPCVVKLYLNWYKPMIYQFSETLICICQYLCVVFQGLFFWFFFSKIKAWIWGVLCLLSQIISPLTVYWKVHEWSVTSEIWCLWHGNFMFSLIYELLMLIDETCIWNV